jgi:hypothetical protein
MITKKQMIESLISSCVIYNDPESGPFNCSNLIIAESTSTTVAVVDMGSYIQITFKGSKELADWLTNGKYNTTGLVHGNQNIKVHAGFKKALDSVYMDVWREVLLLVEISARKPLLINGHSLGGALAYLFVLRSLQTKDKSTLLDLDFNLVTFGSPRCMNVDGAKFMDKWSTRIVRVVNDEDVVPHVPPKLVGFNYKHPGVAVVIGLEGSKTENLWSHLCEKLKSIVVIPEGIRDHRPEEYLKSLSALFGVDLHRYKSQFLLELAFYSQYSMIEDDLKTTVNIDSAENIFSAMRTTLGLDYED